MTLQSEIGRSELHIEIAQSHQSTIAKPQLPLRRSLTRGGSFEKDVSEIDRASVDLVIAKSDRFGAAAATGLRWKL